jgi:hypothetical protein
MMISVEEWLRFISEIIAATTIASAAAAFIAKKVVDHFFAIASEKAKAQLEREAAVWRAELAREAFEHQTRFARLQEKAFDIMAETYARMVRLQRAVGALVAPFVPAGAPTEADRAKAAIEAFNDFAAYFSEREIFLDAETCEQLSELTREIRTVLIEFSIKDRVKDDTDVWMKVHERMSNRVPAIQKRLEKSFRMRLGVEVDVSHALLPVPQDGAEISKRSP